MIFVLSLICSLKHQERRGEAAEQQKGRFAQILQFQMRSAKGTEAKLKEMGRSGAPTDSCSVLRPEPLPRGPGRLVYAGHA